MGNQEEPRSEIRSHVFPTDGVYIFLHNSPLVLVCHGHTDE